MGLREELVAAASQKRLVQRVDVPGLKEPAYVGELTAGERDQWEAYQQKADEDDPDNRASFLACCLCDAEGKRQFTIADVPTLAKLPFSITRPLIIAGKAINGMDKEVEEIAKTFRGATDQGVDLPGGGDVGKNGQ